MCFDFLYNFLSETFFIIRRTERDIIINVHRSSCALPVVVIPKLNFKFYDRFFKNTQMSNFMKVRSVKAELFDLGEQTERYDEADSRFTQLCERA